ncbi:MAG: phosphatase PAP2 family protein [Bacilli bacterium]|nr:phosphatase PAP2 family protein [Bacilli bacterium]
MTKKEKNKRIDKESIIETFGLIILSFIYIIIVRKVDVQMIGPKNSEVGLASINSFFHKLLGSNMTIYKITEILGMIALLIVGIYAVIGLVQLIKRKSLKKVDNKIIALGILYVLLGIVYVLFEKLIINYRPVLIDGELEASFPSSHTMLAICICMSSIMVNKDFIKNKKYLKLTNIGLLILMTLIVLGRFISGVHWFSDIVGGIIISITLLSCFNVITGILGEK